MTSDTPTTIHLPGADGLRLAADVGGPEDGPTVVLLHGGGQTRHSWHGTWRVLVDAGWRAYSLDLRGHGDSDWSDDGDYGLDAFSRDLLAALETLATPPVLVGASLGGITSMVSIAEAADQAAVGRALVLVDVANRIEDEGRQRIGAFMTDRMEEGFGSLEEVADAIAAYNPHRPRPSNLDGLAKNLRRRDDGRWVWHWDPKFITGRMGSDDETRASLVAPERLDRAAAALTVPTLLVRGRSSDLLSEEGARAFLEAAPHAEFVDVAGAGHMVAGDRNDVFNNGILDFLERQRTG